jgi:spore coat protein U-like protein
MTAPASGLLGNTLLPDSWQTAGRSRLAGMDSVAGTSNSSFQPRAFPGRTTVAWAQSVTPGAYNDTITVTVTY